MENSWCTCTLKGGTHRDDCPYSLPEPYGWINEGELKSMEDYENARHPKWYITPIKRLINHIRRDNSVIAELQHQVNSLRIRVSTLESEREMMYSRFESTDRNGA